MSVKNRFIAGLLSLVMVVGMIPSIGLPLSEKTVEAASLSPDLPNITVVSTRDTYTDTHNKTVAVQEETGIAGLVSAAQNVSAYFAVEAWHYSGGYWGGNIPRLIYDNEFKQTVGGVANLEDTLSLGSHTFAYNVPKDSELYKNIEAGEEIVINIGVGEKQKSQDIYLDDLFEVKTARDTVTGEEIYVKDSQGNIQGMSATIKKAKDGGYQILVSLPLVMNYWPEKELGFNETYKLNLGKFIPIPKNGYGHVLFSMWDKNGHIGAAQMWFDEDNPWSIEDMPEGLIHPTMIRPYNMRDAWGVRTGGENNGGLLYEKIPLYQKGKAPGAKQGYDYARQSLQQTETVPKVDRYGNPELDSNGRPIMEVVQKSTIRNVNVSVQENFYMNTENGRKNMNGEVVNFASTRWNIGQGTFAGAGAVGIRFEYDVVLDIYVKPGQKVIASFVELVGVDGEGNPIYETAMESQYMHVETENDISYVDDTITVVGEDGETFSGVLNDVVTSKKDLGNAADVDWSRGLTPSTSSDSIATDAKEIDFYKFNIVTDLTKQVMSEEVFDIPISYLNPDEIVKLTMLTADIEILQIAANQALDAGLEGTFLAITKKIAKRQDTYNNIIATGEERRKMDYLNSNPEGLATVEMMVDSVSNIEDRFRGEIIAMTLEEEHDLQVSGFEIVDPAGYVNTVISSEVEQVIVPASDSDNFFVDDVYSVVDYAVELSNPLNIPTRSLDTVAVLVGHLGSTTFEDEDMSSMSPDGLPPGLSARSVDSYTVENNLAGNTEETQYIPVEGLPTYREGFFEYGSEGTITDNNYIYGNDAGNTIYLRYIVSPEPIQRNRIHVVDENDVEQYVFIIDIDDLVQEDNNGVTTDLHFVDITPELESLGEVTFNEWITSSEKVPDLVREPIPTTGSQGGTTIPDIIQDVPKVEDIYADWTVKLIKQPPVPQEDSVPQWRLSKFSPQFDYWGQASMILNLSSDTTTHVSSYLTPSGNYRYVPVNANEQDANNSNTPANQKLYKWLHTKTLTRGGYSISHDKPYVSVDVNATMTMIKATEDSKHVAAKWVSGNDISTLSQYDIVNGNLPQLYEGPDTYNHTDEIDAGIRNLDTYVHGQAIYYHYDCGGEDCGGHCGCYISTEVPSPSYHDYIYPVDVDFDRYKQKADSNLLTVEPKITETNGLTTIQYQLNPNKAGDAALKIYPEHGMLFVNDAGEESLKWVIGDRVREIKPVVWQTLEHKVYVKPTSNGTSVATDTRGLAKANSIGEANKQIIYKGAGVNTNFRLFRDEDNNNVAIMTAKTYALDFNSSGAMASLKSEWGNGSYNSYDEHKSLIANIEATKTATASEKLLVDTGTYGGSSTEYEGATKTQTTSNYNAIKYTNSDKIKVVSGSDSKAVVFEHRLIVRGGSLIAVEMDNRDGTKTLVSITDLKDRDESLYEAIIGMKLYNESGNRAQTVFSNFEHLAGHALTSEDAAFASLLAQGRFNIDKITTPSTSSVSVGKGWYSEDTTVLVVKEYISNFEVPSISISDKLSMTIGPAVGGLATPTNKAEFFKEMGKGYLYLKYNFAIEGPYENVPKSNAYFEYTSFPTDLIDTKEYSPTGDNSQLDNTQKFGDQSTNYLVPNVSITDTTRLN